jgi:hypothetical protein
MTLFLNSNFIIFQIIFEAIRGVSIRSDTAIDDVKFQAGPCAGNIFPNYINFTKKKRFCRDKHGGTCMQSWDWGACGRRITNSRFAWGYIVISRPV